MRETDRHYMRWPYGMCIDYEEHKAKTSNVLSRVQCYRQCVRHEFRKRFDCFPYFVDNSVFESDLFDTNSHKSKYCSPGLWPTEQYIENIEMQFKKHCLKKCPKDCLTIEYSSTKFKTANNFGTEDWYNETKEFVYERNIIWDSTQPMFSYIEEPVITFTEYLVYCGGLMGLWFGLNANDLIAWTLNARNWIHISHQFYSYFNKL